MGAPTPGVGAPTTVDDDRPALVSFYVGVPDHDDDTIGRAAAIVDDYGPGGGTIVPTRGIWHGKVERSLAVSIVLLPGQAAAVSDMADALKREFRQDAVLVTVSILESAEFI